MSTNRLDFWTHGITTILESPNPPLVLRKSNIGTLVEQEAGTEAWFHIPITTPTVIHSVIYEDQEIYLFKIGLIAKVNQNACVNCIDIRSGTERIVHKGEDEVSFTNMDISETYDVGRHRVGPGLVMSIHVIFLSGTPRGQVTFVGAGGCFEN